MMDDDTEITTRTDYSTESDEHDTPEIDKKRITKEAHKIEKRHPLSPPEPAPEPTAPPESGEQESDNASDGEDTTVDYTQDASAAAGA